MIDSNKNQVKSLGLRNLKRTSLDAMTMENHKERPNANEVCPFSSLTCKVFLTEHGRLLLRRFHAHSHGTIADP